MSLRISNLGLAVLFLSGCGANTSPEPEGESIDCAIGPGAELGPDCILERISASEFVIHRPDGGFRRFRFDEIEGYSLADGAGQLGILSRSDEPFTALRVDEEEYVVPNRLVGAASGD